MRQEDMRKVLEIGVMLSSERNLRVLMNRILGCVMEITNCDAGTLYLKEDDALKFKVSRNNTLKDFAGEDSDPDLPPVKLSRENVCALSFLDDRTIRVDDVQSSSEYDFTGPKRYDSMTGYHTQSMLVTPLRNRTGEVIGVLQLINAMDENGSICTFADDTVLVVESVASQAAITIQNVRYIEDIRALFNSFVQVMSSAIDERTPYNASHSRRMAVNGARFADYLNALGGEYSFTDEQKDEFVMSILLHDIGKLVTPLEVMNKSERLLPAQAAEIAHRMAEVRYRAKLDCLEGRISEAERDGIVDATRAASTLVDKVNRAGFVTDELLGEVAALCDRKYTDENGDARPWLTADELGMLSIRKGTLSESERKIMEDHVVITDRLLGEINFSDDLAHVREWASEHHEYLNGTGYPRHLTGQDIPWQVRIITILDVFDALIADDRPYKPAMPLDRALGILTDMAEKEGKLDVGLTRLFVESRCWEENA